MSTKPLQLTPSVSDKDDTARAVDRWREYQRGCGCNQDDETPPPMTPEEISRGEQYQRENDLRYAQLERYKEHGDEMVRALRFCTPSQCQARGIGSPDYHPTRNCGKCGYCIALAVLAKVAGRE